MKDIKNYILGFIEKHLKTIKQKILAIYIISFIGIAWSYGILMQLFQTNRHLNPISCLFVALKNGGFIILIIGAAVLTGFISYQLLRDNKLSNYDKERNFTYSEKGTYGTANWMNEEELEEVLDKNNDLLKTDGIILGKSLIDDKFVTMPTEDKNDEYSYNRNVMLTGSQGTGKSEFFIKPYIKQCIARGDSIVIADSKGAMYQEFKIELEREGYVVKIWNLKSGQIQYSDSWDFLGEIQDSSIDTMVTVIIANTGSGEDIQNFYDNADYNLLKACCLYVFHEFIEGERTFKEAYKLILNHTAEELESLFVILPATHPARESYQLFANAPKAKGNAVLSLGTRLNLMQDKVIQEITSNKDIDMELPARQKCAYFIVLDDQESTYSWLASLFTTYSFIKTIGYADRQPNLHVGVPSLKYILDEFCNIGKIPNYLQKLATARSRGIGILMAVQSYPQLEARYPVKEWEEIIGGCDLQLFLGGNDLTTARYMSERCGESSIEVATEGREYGTLRMSDYTPTYRKNESVGQRNLLNVEEVLRLKRSQLIVLLGGQKPLKLKKFKWFEHPESKRIKKMTTRAVDHTPKWQRIRHGIALDIPDSKEISIACDLYMPIGNEVIDKDTSGGSNDNNINANFDIETGEILENQDFGKEVATNIVKEKSNSNVQESKKNSSSIEILNGIIFDED